MQIKAEQITLVDIDSLIPWHKNANHHSEEQIERLCKIIKYQGFRNPIIAELGTNIIAAGCGRWLAAKKLKLKKVPVIFQQFENEEQMYSYMVSDNAIADWAELDLSAINNEIIDFGPDYDVEMLGLKDFQVEVEDKKEPEEKEEPNKPKQVQCPNCGEAFEASKYPYND